MPLPAGTQLGPYVIQALLGAGGMGEVYRATDSRLRREVAVKVLPASLSGNEERLRRFEQEARAVAALNHPNILAIFDVGSHDSFPFLVSELLEGETLREKLSEGPLPLRKACDYARQIASGLASAHEKGVIHRDLKPGNVLVTRDGRVKILDFGLAKLLQAEAPAGESAAQATMSATRPGTVVGTPAYMSPEQVRGGAIDERSDIFSLGVVLSEMLSGKSPFQRDTAVETMNAILKEEPAEMRQVPALLNQIIQHCLEKNPAERFQSARDLAFALASASAPSESAVQAVAGISQRRRKVPRWLLFAFLALLAIDAAVAAWWLRARATDRGCAHAVGFDRLTDFVGTETSSAVSPDGKSVAFVADQDGSRQVWVHLVAGGTPLQLTRGTGEHLYPRWTQDSAFIVYYSPPLADEPEGTLWEVSALGGAPRKLASSVSDADVSHDGNRLAFFRLNAGQVQLVVTDRDGANARVVTQAAPGESNRHPRWSPDDRWIAYEHSAALWADDIYVVPSASGEARKVTQEGYLIGGFVWMRDGSAIVYSSARGSTVLYLPVLHLWLQNVDGSQRRQLTFGDATYDEPDIDRNGRVLASRWRMQFDIWKFPIDGNALDNARRGVRLTEQTGQVQTPTLSPGDKELAFLWDSGGHGNIWIKNLESGELRQVTHERNPDVTLGVPIWSPDGKNIAFASTRAFGNWRDVGYWLVSPDGSNLRNPVREGSWATWSPDSRWLYYSEDSPVQAGVKASMVKAPAEGGAPVTVRAEGGISPMLSPEGSTLYYVVPLKSVNGMLDYEIRRAQPENGASALLARISGSRIPVWQGLHPVVSHNGKWLALPLNDSYGTNLWLVSTADGSLRRVVDFGQRRSFIARRICWSADDRFLYAAVGEGDADVVSLSGILP